MTLRAGRSGSTRSQIQLVQEQRDGEAGADDDEAVEAEPEKTGHGREKSRCETAPTARTAAGMGMVNVFEPSQTRRARQMLVVGGSSFIGPACLSKRKSRKPVVTLNSSAPRRRPTKMNSPTREDRAGCSRSRPHVALARAEDEDHAERRAADLQGDREELDDPPPVKMLRRRRAGPHR